MNITQEHLNYKDMKIYIGIDPGSVSGSIAFLKYDNDQLVEIGDMQFGKHTPKEWFEAIYSLGDDECFCVVESVHSMPKQGVTSAFTFGKNAGMIEMALIASKIPYQLITPHTWMKAYGMRRNKKESKTEWKKRLRERLQQLMPELKVTNANADAYLIALYCANEKRNG